MKITIVYAGCLTLLSLVIFSFVGCTPAPTDIKTEIEALNQSSVNAYNNGDIKAFTASYAPNAKLYPSNSEIIEGAPAIEGFWNAVKKMGIQNVRLETVKAEKIGNIAIEEGHYTLFAPGDVIADQGKYLVTWEKDGGQWKITRDIWNSSQPAPVARAGKDDGVWVIAYHVKGNKASQFEEFNTNYLKPAGDEFFPAVAKTVRLLSPQSQNPDGTYTYFYLMDPMLKDADYQMMTILEAKYGKEKAAEYLKMCTDCVNKYESYKMVQTKW